MRPLLSLALLLVLFAIAGCALNRSDFETGSNGAPDRSQMSDTGKTVSNIAQNGPRLRLDF